MGAWGSGIFEDDSTLDCFDLLKESKAIKCLKSFLKKRKEKYIDYEAGAGIIVAAAAIDGILNGINHDTTSDEFLNWVSENKNIKVNEFVTLAIKGLEQVIGEESELNELWQENTEEYENWKLNITNIIDRLNNT
jgi:hypothetical protein